MCICNRITFARMKIDITFISVIKVNSFELDLMPDSLFDVIKVTDLADILTQFRLSLDGQVSWYLQYSPLKVLDLLLELMGW